jgi:hypothetical protein
MQPGNAPGDAALCSFVSPLWCTQVPCADGGDWLRRRLSGPLLNKVGIEQEGLDIRLLLVFVIVLDLYSVLSPEGREWGGGAMYE